MAAAAKVTPRPWDDQALQLLAPSLDGSQFSLVSTIEEQLHGSQLWEFDFGNALALVALTPVQFARGRTVEVAGLRSLGERLQPHQVRALDAVARDAYGADLLSMATRHPHLARTCERAGWCRVAPILVKPLRVQ